MTTGNAPQRIPDDTLLTFKEVMRYLRVSRSTLCRLMSAEQLTGHKVGSQWRFFPADVQASVRADFQALSSDENQTKDLVAASCEGGAAWQ